MRDSAFVEAVGQDPLLREVKLIAEPWDMRGYDLGRFPSPWAEWNDQYRDCLRGTWHRLTPSLADARDPAVRLGRHLPAPLADRIGQLRHRPRRLHAGRSGELRAQAQPRQRRAQPRRHRQQRLAQRRRRRADQRPADPGRPPQAAPRPAGDAAAVGRRPDAGGRRRARPHPARQQQRLLPGQRDLLGAPGPTTGAIRPAPIRCSIPLVSGLLRLRRRSPVLRRTTFFLGGRLAARRHGQPGARHQLVPARRRVDGGRRLARRHRDPAPVRAGAARPARRKASASSTTAT